MQAIVYEIQVVGKSWCNSKSTPGHFGWNAITIVTANTKSVYSHITTELMGVGLAQNPCRLREHKYE